MDVATLAIKVENGDVVKATTALDSLTVAGGKSEAATQRLTRRMALLQIEARNMDDAMGRMNPTIAKLTSAFSGLAAVAALGFIGRETVRNTEEAQAAMAQLEAAVKSTGGAAGRTVAQLDALSMSLQNTTTFSDEAVKGAQAMLLTFDQIRGAEFDRATAAVTDLAARMGGDLQGAAVQVGKALQDPTTGLTALRRSGVSFSESQLEVIKRLYETGQAAEGQRVILKELEHQFGGSAAAARDTLGGALTSLKNAWGDLFEVTRGASQGTVVAINAITKSMQDSGLSMNQFVINTVVGWEKIKSAAQKAHEIMSLSIGPGFFDRAKAISERIDFDLSAKLAALNAPAKIGPALTPPPRSPFSDSDTTKQAAKDLEALQKATDDYYNSLNQHQIDALKTVAATKEENAALRDMIEATRQGQDAVDTLTIAQAGANAVRELGVGVSDKVATAVRREAEEHARLAIQLGHVKDAQSDAAAAQKKAEEEAQRQMEHRARELQRSTSNAIEQGITDVVNGKNPLIALADGFKRAMIHAISEALAEKFLASKFAAMLGIGVDGAATKQVADGSIMLQAATLQVQAANAMMMGGYGSRSSNGIVINDTNGGLVAGKQPSGLNTGLGYAGIAAGAGITGYQMGGSFYSTSHGAAGNYARGGIAGAGAGALAGATIGSVIPGIGTAVGAVVGGIIGLTAGLFGMGAAAKASAAEVREMRASLASTMEGLRAEVSKDSLAASIAQVHAQSSQIRKQIEDAYSGGGANSDTVRERNKLLAETNALEAERIRQLKEEIAVQQTRQIEDYTERTLRAQGKTKEADDYHFQHAQQREREDLVRSFGSEIDAREKEILAAYDQAAAAEKAAHAQGKATDALNAFTTALHNAPQGYKYQRDVFAFASPRVMPGDPQWAVPTNPFSPPRSPLNPPQLSSTGTTRPSVTIAPVFQIDGTKTTRAQVQQIGVELRKIVNETLGKDADTAEGWGLLA